MSESVMLEEKMAQCVFHIFNSSGTYKFFKGFCFLILHTSEYEEDNRCNSQSGSIDDNCFISRVSEIKCFSMAVTFKKLNIILQTRKLTIKDNKSSG